MSSKRASNHEPHPYLKSFIALLLVFGCLWASQWQFQRGIDRHQQNSRIESQLQLPVIDLAVIKDDYAKFEWRTVTTTGVFDSKDQILLKNRYFEGIYGYEVLTRFTTTDSRSLWIDRGWVKAGKDATTAPVVTAPPTESVSIQARLRLDRSLPQGAFFALPTNGGGLISKLNAQAETNSQGFYLDLISGSDQSLTPSAPAQLPELSDGPHLAYSLQWIFFAGLIIYGRILIRRGQILTSKKL